MKPVRLLLLGTALLLGACVPRPSEPPPQRPEPRPTAPAPQPVPPPPPPITDWRDMPLTPGDWFYRDTGQGAEALFGPREDQPVFAFRCDRGARSIRLARTGITTGNTMTVRTSAGARNFPLSIEASGSPYGSAAATDRFLDAIIFSRGRFTIEVPGTPMLILPSWPEPARVLEECRS